MIATLFVAAIDDIGVQIDPHGGDLDRASEREQHAQYTPAPAPGLLSQPGIDLAER